MTAHSLFHAIDSAYCKVAWQKMKGTDRVRSCPRCHTAVYQLDGLSERECNELILSTRSDGAPHLSRRFDGTFVCDNLPCGNFIVPYWRDWLSSAKLVLTVLAGSPILVTLVVVVFVARSLLTSPGYNGLLPLLSVVSWLLNFLIECRLVVACRGEKESFVLQAGQKQWIWNALVFQIIYAIGCSVGFFLLVIPGLIWSIRGCVGLVTAIVENKNPIDSFRESFKLTRGASSEIFNYLCMPFLLMGALYLGLVAILPSTGTIAEVMFPYQLMITFIGFSVVPLEINLYGRLKARRFLADKIKSETQMPRALD